MKKVLVAMSGGVDSSAAAALLVEQGYEVSGATMKLFGGDIGGAEDAAGDAKSVCDALGVDHYVFDCADIFKRRVIDNFIDGYMSGDTPNPCIDCNRHLKFGAFIDRAEALGFDLIATGHYARIGFDEASGRWLVKKARDAAKDQSYVLYMLTQERLAKILLPLGDYTKNEVRDLAAARGLSSAQSPESQDICFIPNGGHGDFIAARAESGGREGDILDTSGAVLGRHRGIEYYTIGQRKGIGVSSGAPLYVREKNKAANTITLGGEHELYTKTLTARGINFISVERLDAPVGATVRIRYNGKEFPATLRQISEDEAAVEFEIPQRAITSGQAAVFYDGDAVIGGGTIC